MLRLALLFMPAVLAVQAATLVVGQGAAFNDIRQAVQAAQAGDTVQVLSGTYTGNLLLDKTITLEGIGAPLLRGTGAGSVVAIEAPGCTLRGFRIEHSGPMLVEEDSGVLLRSDGNHIENNQLRDVLFGIYLFHSSHNWITRNTIRGRKELGSGERGGGIHIWYSADNTLDLNIISDMRDGMYLQNADRTTVRGNHVSNLRYGLHYMYSNDNVFEDNIFDNNVAGAAIMYSRNIRFRRNSFVHNRGFSSFGILFQDSQNCVAEQNVIVDNVVGIFMEALRDSRFEQNLIAANDTSIEVFASSERNEFTRNNFVANLSPIRTIGKNSNIRWEREGVGNYWSEYKGYDLNADGIGDTPFRVQNLFDYMEGSRPRLRIYFFSAASSALAEAEQTFPVIEGSHEFDRHPLMKPVDVPTKLPDEMKTQRGTLALAGLPASMFLAAAFVLWKGRAR